MGEWKDYYLSDLLTIQRGHDLVQTEFILGDYPVAGSNGPIGYHNKFTSRGPGITIGRSGNSIGVTHYYKQDFWAHNTTLYSKEFKNSIPKFLYYYFRTIDFKTLNSGSAVPSLNRNHLYKLLLTIPTVDEQERIAEVLSSLDDKIDLLHNQNKTLEEMAGTLFRQWFVEEAKEDWEEVTLGSLCIKITKGTTPTTMGKPFVEHGINFIKAESLNEFGGFIYDKFSFIDESTHDLLQRSQINNGDILFTIAGTIGRTAIVTSRILPANTNQAVAIIRVDNKMVNQIFMKYVMKSDYIQEIMETKIVHAVQPNLSLGEISGTKINLPPKEKLDKFELVGKSVQDKINLNNNHIQQLETLRDTLIPKLMSGLVTVNEIA
jgi:type I restriction enzyme S subunit